MLKNSINFQFKFINDGFIKRFHLDKFFIKLSVLICYKAGTTICVCPDFFGKKKIVDKFLSEGIKKGVLKSAHLLSSCKNYCSCYWAMSLRTALNSPLVIFTKYVPRAKSLISKVIGVFSPTSAKVWLFTILPFISTTSTL